MDMPKTMDRQDWGLLILLSILWGGTYFFAGVAVKEVPPLTVVLVRVLLAAILLLPLFWYFGHSLPRTFSSWLPFVGMGLLNNVLPFGLIFAGQTQITVGLSSIINAMTPLFTVLVMAVFLEERLTVNRVIGVLLGVVGVAVLRGFDGPISGNQTLGIILCMAGALSYGFAALWGRRFLAGIPALKSATCQLISSTVIIAVVVAIIDKPWALPIPSVEVIFSLLALAAFGTAVAYIVFFRILVRAGASNAMLVTLLIPVTALVLGNIFLDEAVQAKEIIGAFIIGAGLLFIDGRVIHWLGGKYRITD
ncbi:DMT family transporter [Sneathiella marina]|uniref:DMT family transporter n=1 Tax=Sneathiella marina TaxID=2950108 RepID=A0ABY4W7U5_9PROT|nr:DMT family transporter [Sneathiella marina]USG63123.1 DMT family transporter [Sneathiella marina]